MTKDVVELLLELKEDVSSVASDVRILKEKLDEHSRKSRETAMKVEELEKDSYKLKGAIALILVLSTLIGLYKALQSV
jgi:peptidoglycan hydrolase CwlO-like protein